MIHRNGGRVALAVASLLFASLALADPTADRAAADAARDAGDSRGELGHRMRLAEAQQDQGRYADARETLARALELAKAFGDARPIAAVRGALGNAHAALREDALAERELSQATAMARQAGAHSLAASLGNNLGNFLAMRAAQGAATADRAANSYATARDEATKANDVALSTRILGNEARLQLEQRNVDAAEASLEQALLLAADLPESRENVLTRIHLGASYAKLFAARATSSKQHLLAANALLTRAHEDAKRLGDIRSSAWAQGTLGSLYAQRGHLEEALTLTRRAVFDAQQAGALDAELRFQIESARLLARLGKRDEALASYRVAVEQLAEIRPALGIAYARAAGSLREEAALAYREMADLLLARAAKGGPSSEQDLLLTQQLMERFKADELRDYFHDDCVDAFQERVTGAGDVQGALIVYPIVLADRLEILVTREGRIRRFAVPVGHDELSREVHLLRSLLEKRVTRQYLPHAQKVYDWLIRPIEAELAASRGATLVFVPDGVLRIVPMAALHDGKQFLIERHPVATTPGLELSDPRPIDRSDPKVLLAGLSRAVQGYDALPHVRNELEAIGALFPGDTLLDEGFVEGEVEGHITGEAYGLVHLASHGQLGAQVEDSFLVTHDGRIDLTELSSYLTSTRYREKPIEIITLSACDTASGDERAALGLSGLAVRAGARSALGSLWLVNDEAASRLMIDFYTELRKPGVSRAHALQQAQQHLLSDSRWRHPSYWAPFLLISNWL